MQNFIVFIDEEAISSSRSFNDTFDISLKGGKMCFNRFCIDEDAAFELSGVHYLKSPILKEKGRENSFS